MIDHTNLQIEEVKQEIRRENERRYAFYRMLRGTDRVLERLEEMNLEGVQALPDEVRRELEEVVSGLPENVQKPVPESARVQEALDGLFEVQERLFRWRYPEWSFEDEAEGVERAS
ncbi:MAG TPA: hypothetical protein VK131_01720 [Candidatus Acidoferrales bacterium]|nr:hypothetical protein [Candidatus Acidoferrales bacterium]